MYIHWCISHPSIGNAARPQKYSLLPQDHTVFARHEKFGMFQVPNEFLNTNKQAPAAVAPKKSVRQARRAYSVYGIRRAARAAILRKMRSYLVW